VREYVMHKAMYPATVPQELKELHLEHALAREALRLALGQVRFGWPLSWRGADKGLLPAFDPILGAGAALAGAPRPAHAALILLDALEPAGIVPLALDVNGLAPALGAIAAVQPLAVAQLWASGAVPRLGIAVAPVGPQNAQPGQAVVRVKVAVAGGETTEAEVVFGSVKALRVAVGQTATVSVQPARGFDVGRGAGRGVMLRDVRGGGLGVIVDARGRPLRLPRDAAARSEAVQKWLESLGG
jgi:hypothetical protein